MEGPQQIHATLQRMARGCEDWEITCPVNSAIRRLLKTHPVISWVKSTFSDTEKISYHAQRVYIFTYI